MVPAIDRYRSRKYCAYLERICNLRSLDSRSKQWIVDQFLQVQNVSELGHLCHYIQDRLRAIAACQDYFTV